MNCDIRKATVGDIPAIRAMAEIAFPDTYKDILSPEQLEYMMQWMYSEESLRRQMTIDGHRFFVIDGKGYVSFRTDGMTDDGVRRYHLEKLYITPECQGCGLGRRLFHKVVDEVLAESNGSAVIELNVNRNNKALAFYQRLGLHIDRSGDFPIGNGFFMNDYIMQIRPRFDYAEARGKKTVVKE